MTPQNASIMVHEYIEYLGHRPPTRLEVETDHHFSPGRFRRSFQRLNASSHVPLVSHLSATIFQLRVRMICSTVRSFRTKLASDSVRASRGKYRLEYGSKRSLTTRSCSLVVSTCRETRSGSSGSGLVATIAQ